MECELCGEHVEVEVHQGGRNAYMVVIGAVLCMDCWDKVKKKFE